MNFGALVRDRRSVNQLSVQALALKSRLDAGTISRIENEHTQATISSAVAICERLGIKLEELIEVLVGKAVQPVVESYQDNRYQVPVLTVADVERFEILFATHYKEARMLLAEWLNLIFELWIGEGRDKEDVPARFSPKDIDKLLLQTPFYCFELKYPQFMNTSTILHILRHDGIVIPADVEHFIKTMRVDLLNNGETGFGEVMKRLDTSSYERAKLVDVLAADALLSANGAILAMYWKAIKFNGDTGDRYYSADTIRDAAQSWRPQPEGLTTFFIMICRWIASLDGGDISWLERMRSDIDDIVDKFNGLFRYS
jgi:transcriptional regulator with XRE-family HTH domain